MDTEALAEKIKHLRYVVMRNWEKMPPSGDIDFFVHPEDAEVLRAICAVYLPEHFYDIRTVGDNYFSPLIEDMLLTDRREYKNWWVPSEQAFFLSLYYHGLIHKGDNRYDETLKKVFFGWMNPKPPTDPGVGFHDIDSN